MVGLDLVGETLNKLRVVEFTGYSHPKRGKVYRCECVCGNTVDVPTAYIRKKSTYSCGCVKRPRKDKGVKRAQVKRNGTRLYRIWKNMRRRCNNPNSDYYKNYGGRGIKVCTEWDNYLVFKEWAISNGYSDGLSIDRINNDGNYEPSNCRWATRKQQNNNARSNINITYKGETKTAAQWADEIGLTRSAIYHRINRGWNTKDIIETPLGEKRDKTSPKAHLYEYKGKKMTVKDLSKINGIKTATIKYRIEAGWPIEKAVNKGIMKNQFG